MTMEHIIQLEQLVLEKLVKIKGKVTRRAYMSLLVALAYEKAALSQKAALTS